MIDIDKHIAKLKEIEKFVPSGIKTYFFDYGRYDPNSELGFHDSKVKNLELSINSENLFDHDKLVVIEIENKWKDRREKIQFLGVSDIVVQLDSGLTSKPFVEGQVLWVDFIVFQEMKDSFRVEYLLDGNSTISLVFKECEILVSEVK